MINPLCGFCLVKLTKIVLQVLVSMHLGFQQDEIDGYLLIFFGCKFYYNSLLDWIFV